VADAESLFALHRQGVFRYLCRVVGRPDTAQDLTQEVFLRVTRTRVPDADPSGHRAWVFKIARNLVLNHVRDGMRRGQPVALVDSSAPATQEMAVAIKQAIGALAEGDRDVFLLRESAGLSYGEIAVAVRSDGRSRARPAATRARTIARRARWPDAPGAARLSRVSRDG
jgi:RNA polymerase sigma-70 factor (ECF subfamily)